MKAPKTLAAKLERLETLVDALIEERTGLRGDLKKIRGRAKTSQKSGDESDTEKMIEELEQLRSRLADTQASNQQLVRERNTVRERLTQIRNRLDQVEAQLLDKRSASSGSKG